MNALELAECFELYAIDHNPDGFPAIRQGTLNSAAEMLRKQHEAIKQMREALTYASTYVQEDEAERGKPYFTGQVIRQALKDTEHLK